MSLSTTSRAAFFGTIVVWLLLAGEAAAQDPELQHFRNITPPNPGSSDGSAQPSGGGGSPSGGPGAGGDDPGVERDPGTPGNLKLHPPPGGSVIPTFGMGKQINHSKPAPVNQHFELRLIPAPIPPATPSVQNHTETSPSFLANALKSAASWADRAERRAALAWAAAKLGPSDTLPPERVRSKPEISSPKPMPANAHVPEHIDKDKMAEWIDKSAHDTYQGTCAHNCRMALEAAGIDTTGHPVYAKDYGPFLQDHGFSVVPLDNSYVPQKGDVVVFAGNDAHPFGHMEIHDGKEWVSDKKQGQEFSPYKSSTPPSVIYRFKGPGD